MGGARVNALSNAFDDLSRDFGLRVYEEMMRDPQVAAAVNVFKLGILSQGVRLVNRYGKDDPKYSSTEPDFCAGPLSCDDSATQCICKTNCWDACGTGTKCDMSTCTCQPI